MAFWLGDGERVQRDVRVRNRGVRQCGRMPPGTSCVHRFRYHRKLDLRERRHEVTRNHRPQAWIRRLRMRRAARRVAHVSAHPPPREVHVTAAKAIAAHDHTLQHAYAAARTAAIDNRRVEPAAEWLIDNVYLIRNEIRKVRETLPASVWRRLPCNDFDGEAVPRILRALRACIAQLDGNVEPRAVEQYLEAYQRHATFDLIELWTLPVLVRVALIEGLASDAVAITRRMQAYAGAEYWAELLIGVATRAPNDMLVSVAEMAGTDVFASPAFAAEFYRLLEGKHPSLKLALTFAEQQLEQRGTSVARVIDEESRAQAADQVSIANRINSLRRLGEYNWSELLERVGAVDRTLGEDPAGAYADMD